MSASAPRQKILPYPAEFGKTQVIKIAFAITVVTVNVKYTQVAEAGVLISFANGSY